MTEIRKIKMPNTCHECIFNYDGIYCRLFKEKYEIEVDETFDPYKQRPNWCNMDSIVISWDEK